MEITLYDKDGRPKAYISEEKKFSIYLWSGESVCYLRNEIVYGWRGKHIGWYVDEILYTLKGEPIAFTKRTCPSITYAEPIKYVKRIQYVRTIPTVPYARKRFSNYPSSEDLVEFLSQK